MRQFQYLYKSKIGTLYLVGSEIGLQGVFWTKQKAPLVENLALKDPVVQILKNTKNQIEHFLEGSLKKFNLPLDLIGTDFQKKVWGQLVKIPYGKTLSYTDIARKLGCAQAVRAVGAANGRNPLSIIIPCHRVISSSGKLTGYSGGLKIKARLLALERK